MFCDLLCVVFFTQATDRSGGASLSGGGEGKPGAEDEGRDQRCQTRSTETEGAPRGNCERAEPTEIRRGGAGAGTIT